MPASTFILAITFASLRSTSTLRAPTIWISVLVLMLCMPGTAACWPPPCAATARPITLGSTERSSKPSSSRFLIIVLLGLNGLPAHGLEAGDHQMVLALARQPVGDLLQRRDDRGILLQEEEGLLAIGDDGAPDRAQ